VTEGAEVETPEPGKRDPRLSQSSEDFGLDGLAFGGHFGLDGALERLAEKLDTVTFDEMMLTLSRDLRQIFRAERITVYVVDPLRNEIASRFKDGDEVREIRVPIAPRSIAGFVASEARTVRFADVYDRAELATVSPVIAFDRSWDERSGFRTKQVLAAPIRTANRVQGVVQLINRLDDLPFTPTDEAQIERVAGALATAFTTKRVVVVGGSRFHRLVLGGHIDEAALDAVREEARAEGVSPEAILLRRGVPREAILASLAEFFETEAAALDAAALALPADTIARFDGDMLLRNGCAPIADDGETVTVAVANPRRFLFCEEVVERLADREIAVRVAIAEEIEAVIDRFYFAAPPSEEPRGLGPTGSLPRPRPGSAP
jgi:GAF domain-containing protein